MVSKQKLRGVSLVCAIGGLLALCGCQGLKGSTPVSSNPGIESINHIVFMAQENRSLDTYFGQLPAYWQANGFPSQAFDGMPAGASNPSFDGTTTIPAYHVATECFENVSPSWNESHVDWNRTEPTSATATMDGFVFTAAKTAMDDGFFDTAGLRAMGYYDGSDLNYYYFMASNFATSDRWFSPVMDRTQVNRMYLFAATSHGYAYPPGTNANDNAPLNVPTIFDALTQAGVSWKIYASDDTCPGGATGDIESPKAANAASNAHGAAPNAASTGFCTYLTQFAQYSSPNPLPSNVVSADQFLTDAQAGTLPAVAFIEGGYTSGRDEHPDNNVQTGAAYVSTLINGLMTSPSWKDSVFILTYDEAGGVYDHVPPQPAVSPDGIAPIDLQPNDICTGNGGANCDFTHTGFRLPLVVVSPFTRKNYVSHTVADYTAILKLIETRFNVPSLTHRDAAQMDMTEFFDFANVPWATPPTPPAQATNGVCDFQHLQ
jgi:phospholipase C